MTAFHPHLSEIAYCGNEMSLRSGILPVFLCIKIHFLKMLTMHVAATLNRQVCVEPIYAKPQSLLLSIDLRDVNSVLILMFVIWYILKIIFYKYHCDKVFTSYIFVFHFIH